MHHLARERGAFRLRDVGKIGDDSVQGAFDIAEKVGLKHADVGNPERGGIFLSKGKGVQGDIGEGDLPGWAGGGERQA